MNLSQYPNGLNRKSFSSPEALTNCKGAKPRFILILFRQIIIFFSLFLCYGEVEASKVHKYPSSHINDRTRQQLRQYMLTDDVPIKEKLDQIFSRSRVLANWETLIAAGFDALPPQHQTRMIVAKHPELKGYVIKVYLDTQSYYRNKPEYYHWVNRIKGAQLIQKYLQKYEYEHLFKVPKKWIYLLPQKPSAPALSLSKKTILVAEDMELFDEKTNEAQWGSEWVTQELLDALYKITTHLGLRDSTKPSNCPFSIDGKAAFVDTEIYFRGNLKYQKLTPFLSPEMKTYWENINH